MQKLGEGRQCFFFLNLPEEGAVIKKRRSCLAILLDGKRHKLHNPQ
ncbi:MAG: hypothetical protein ACI9JM_001484 [Halioglobus sp.]|jgi:hypothetical protein